MLKVVSKILARIHVNALWILTWKQSCFGNGMLVWMLMSKPMPSLYNDVDDGIRLHAICILALGVYTFFILMSWTLVPTTMSPSI